MSHSEISLLNSTTFKGLKSLQELDLSYNRRLRALPRHIFSDQFKLLHLDLRATLLYDIPSQTLATLYSLQYLYLSYLGSAFDILMRDLYNLTKLEDLRIVGLNSKVTNVTVHPLAGLPIQNLTLVWLPFSANHSMETTAFAPFTSIHKLFTDFLALPALGSLHSPLENLSLASWFEKFQLVLHNTTFQVLSKFKESLTNLELLLQNLNQIDNDAFMWIPNLITLVIWDCKVQTVAQHSFRGLTALQTLDLQNNQLTAVPSEALNVIGIFTSFQHLDLSLNSLWAIADDAFSGVTSLTYLNLGNNKNIYKLEYTRWLHLLLNLKHLVFGNFEMSRTFASISLPRPLLSLQTFEIRNVGTLIFEPNFCLSFPNSRSLILSSALIVNFPFSLSLHECSSLIEIDLSGSLENIDSPDLKHITISIPTLEGLALARNKLKSITQILFIKAPNLISLNLSDNQIKIIDNVIANAFKRLIRLSIDGNALISLSGLEDLTYLEHLSAARNQITQVPLWLTSKSSGLVLMTLDLSVIPYHCSCKIENFENGLSQIQILGCNQVNTVVLLQKH